MSDFLTSDVLIDVLTRLPVKTLVRCLCVCKSWYDLVTNPRFITTHINRSSLRKKNDLMLVRRCSSDGYHDQFDVECYEEHYSLLHCENKMLCDHAEFEPPLISFPNDYFRIIGSCNGLVCLSDDLPFYKHGIYLWNPSIQKTMGIPFESHGWYMHSIGFGFDSLNDDYKVVRIVYPACRSPPQIDIFSLKTGTWRDISHLGLEHTIDERAPQAFLNGAVHWLAEDRIDWSKFIVSFHMSDEVFSEIEVPSSVVHDDWLSDSEVRVSKFQESLSLIHIQDDDFKFTCCVWVMKEYGMSESWTTLFNIDLSGGLGQYVAGFTRNGEVLFANKSGNLVAYDPEAKQVTHVHFRGSTDSWNRDSFYADAYTESLVLVTCKKSPDLLLQTMVKKRMRGEASKRKE